MKFFSFLLNAYQFVTEVSAGTFANDLVSIEKISAKVSVYTPLSEKSQGR